MDDISCVHKFTIVLEAEKGRYVDVTDRAKRIKAIDDFYAEHYRPKGFWRGNSCVYNSSCICFGKGWECEDLKNADKNGWISERNGKVTKVTKLACCLCGEIKKL